MSDLQFLAHVELLHELSRFDSVVLSDISLIQSLIGTVRLGRCYYYYYCYYY